MPADLRVILLTPTIQFSGTFPSDLWTIITIKVKTVVSSLLNTTVSSQIKDDHIWAVLCSLALNQLGQFACHSLVRNSRRFCLSRTSEPAVPSPSDTRNCWGSPAAFLCYSSTWDEQDWKSLIHTGDCPPHSQFEHTGCANLYSCMAFHFMLLEKKLYCLSWESNGRSAPTVRLARSTLRHSLSLTGCPQPLLLHWITLQIQNKLLNQCPINYLHWSSWFIICEVFRFLIIHWETGEERRKSWDST